MSYEPLRLASVPYLPVQLTGGASSLLGPGYLNGEGDNGVVLNGNPDQYRAGGTFPGLTYSGETYPPIRRAS